MGERILDHRDEVETSREKSRELWKLLPADQRPILLEAIS